MTRFFRDLEDNGGILTGLMLGAIVLMGAFLGGAL